MLLNPRHRKIYDTHLKGNGRRSWAWSGTWTGTFTILKSLTVLRQLSLDPALVDAKYDGVRSAKIDVFLEHLTELVSEGHRTLVFSHSPGSSAGSVTASTPPARRTAISTDAPATGRGPSRR